LFVFSVLVIVVAIWGVSCHRRAVDCLFVLWGKNKEKNKHKKHTQTKECIPVEEADADVKGCQGQMGGGSGME
jgi:hypothetical protein